MHKAEAEPGEAKYSGQLQFNLDRLPSGNFRDWLHQTPETLVDVGQYLVDGFYVAAFTSEVPDTLYATDCFYGAYHHQAGEDEYLNVKSILELYDVPFTQLSLVREPETEDEEGNVLGDKFTFLLLPVSRDRVREVKQVIIEGNSAMGSEINPESYQNLIDHLKQKISLMINDFSAGKGALGRTPTGMPSDHYNLDLVTGSCVALGLPDFVTRQELDDAMLHLAVTFYETTRQRVPTSSLYPGPSNYLTYGDREIEAAILDYVQFV